MLPVNNFMMINVWCYRSIYDFKIASLYLYYFTLKYDLYGNNSTKMMFW